MKAARPNVTEVRKTMSFKPGLKYKNVLKIQSTAESRYPEYEYVIHTGTFLLVIVIGVLKLCSDYNDNNLYFVNKQVELFFIGNCPSLKSLDGIDCMPVCIRCRTRHPYTVV